MLAERYGVSDLLELLAALRGLPDQVAPPVPQRGAAPVSALGLHEYPRHGNDPAPSAGCPGPAAPVPDLDTQLLRTRIETTLDQGDRLGEPEPVRHTPPLAAALPILAPSAVLALPCSCPHSFIPSSSSRRPQAEWEPVLAGDLEITAEDGRLPLRFPAIQGASWLPGRSMCLSPWPPGSSRMFTTSPSPPGGLLPPMHTPRSPPIHLALARHHYTDRRPSSAHARPATSYRASLPPTPISISDDLIFFHSATGDGLCAFLEYLYTDHVAPSPRSSSSCCLHDLPPLRALCEFAIMQHLPTNLHLITQTVNACDHLGARAVRAYGAGYLLYLFIGAPPAWIPKGINVTYLIRVLTGPQVRLVEAIERLQAKRKGETEQTTAQKLAAQRQKQVEERNKTKKYQREQKEKANARKEAKARRAGRK
ncbi:hypothetical protein PAPYR_2121 [Paratrimastix pyriformis]|uniref:BTB domain-containing protein n=1 Tax=Paratrimastix pyriformis TaxID=342808 RepID=A0ABQ8UQU9_9EUKA|nr:hypothetical protein PAPYR_2121 [Paratrimastix pyriformis]